MKVIIEGIILSVCLYLSCAWGIRNGAVHMVFLYDKAVQDSFIQFLNRCVPADFPDKASYIVFLFVGTVQEKG